MNFDKQTPAARRNDSHHETLMSQVSSDPELARGIESELLADGQSTITTSNPSIAPGRQHFFTFMEE